METEAGTQGQAREGAQAQMIVRELRIKEELAEVVQVMADDDVLSNGHTPKDGILREGLKRLLRPDTIVAGFFHGKKVVGYAWATKLCSITWQVHIGVLKAHRGPETLKASTEALKIAYRHGARKLVGIIPENNIPSNRLAEKLGFTCEGRLEKAFELSGERYALNVWGLSLYGEE
jgi:hypothetical protein